jgi:hypothetical protein
MTETRTDESAVILTPRRFIRSEHLRNDLAREVALGVDELAKQYPNLPQSYWKFNETTGEINGSYLHKLILANEFLAEKGARTPTFYEGMQLDRKGKLTNGVYRDYGVCLYDEREPNSKTAEMLVKEAKKRGWELPVLAHPRSLKLSSKGSDVLFSDDTSLVIFGQEARDELKNFGYVGKSGVCGVDRYRGSGWLANWNDLGSSNDDGRVDWICREATRENFDAELIAEAEREYAEQIKVLNKRKAQALNAAHKIM